MSVRSVKSNRGKFMIFSFNQKQLAKNISYSCKIVNNYRLKPVSI